MEKNFSLKYKSIILITYYYNGKQPTSDLKKKKHSHEWEKLWLDNGTIRNSIFGA